MKNSAAAVFDGEALTKREVLIARVAYMKGLSDAQLIPQGHRWNLSGMECRAKNAYPLPPVTRPRVVPDPHNHEPQWGRPREWACMGGVIVSRTIGLCVRRGNAPFKWTQTAQVPPTYARCKLWADLLANPNETVSE